MTTQEQTEERAALARACLDQCTAWVESEQWQEIEAAMPQYMRQYPEHRAFFLNTQALALYKTGEKQQAVRLFAQSNQLLQGRHPQALRNLVRAQLETKDSKGALKNTRKGIRRFPDEMCFPVFEARALVDMGHWQDGLHAWRKVTERYPNPYNHFMRGVMEMDLGHKALALQCFQKALDEQPSYTNAGINWLMYAHYEPSESAASLQAKHAHWYALSCANLAKTPSELLERDRTPERTLRIGLISSGFFAHPVGWMSHGALCALGKYLNQELYFYDTREKHNPQDFATKALMETATQWKLVHGYTNERLYQEMLDDKLDILIEMSGHSEGSRLALVARRVAPVQIKWVGGLFNSSGVPEMDYLLTDHMETPEGTDDLYTEKLIRMPNGYVTYTYPNYAPDILPPPSIKKGYVTFGCFNNIHKINPEIIALWSQILASVPRSRILLKGGKYSNADVQSWIYGLFAQHGIEKKRVLLEGSSPHHLLLNTYNKVDIALDPWPYTGGLSTVEALYMGVPVLTTPGPTFAGRHAASHLNNVGLRGCIAQNFAQYVAKAVELAQRPDLLSNYRTCLRQVIKQSPLCNHVQFAADLHYALRVVWYRYCENLPPAQITFNGNTEIPHELRL